jgi:hypothetical protein
MQKSTVFLLVLALASAGVSAGLWMELRAERALNAELSERLDSVLAPRTQPGRVVNPRAEPSTMIAPVAATATAAPIPAAEPAGPKFSRDSREDWQARQRQLMSDPRYREALREQQRLRLATRRENFIRLLGFTPEQADAAIDLSIERQMAWQEANMHMASEEASQQQKERLEAQEREYQAKLRDLLGEAKTAELENYMESRQTRMQVDRFRMQLGGAEPLREDQVEPLIAALHAEQSQMEKEMQESQGTMKPEGDPAAFQRQYAERQTEAMKAAHKRMHSAATGILSSSQLEKLDAMLKRDLERHEAQQRMARIQSKLEPPTDVPGNSN